MICCVLLYTMLNSSFIRCLFPTNHKDIGTLYFFSKNATTTGLQNVKAKSLNFKKHSVVKNRVPPMWPTLTGFLNNASENSLFFYIAGIAISITILFSIYLYFFNVSLLHKNIFVVRQKYHVLVSVLKANKFAAIAFIIIFNIIIGLILNLPFMGFVIRTTIFLTLYLILFSKLYDS